MTDEEKKHQMTEETRKVLGLVEEERTYIQMHGGDFLENPRTRKNAISTACDLIGLRRPSHQSCTERAEMSIRASAILVGEIERLLRRAGK